MGGVDVGNPGMSAYQAEYNSSYGYSLRYSSKVSLEEPSPSSVRLKTQTDQHSTLSVNALDNHGIKSKEPELVDLISEQAPHTHFERKIGKKGEIVYAASTSANTEVSYRLTPQGKILVLELTTNDQDPLKDELTASLQSLDYDLTPPKIESISSPSLQNGFFEITLKVSGLRPNEEARASLVLKRMDSDPSPIRIRPILVRDTKNSLKAIFIPKDLPQNGEYLISRLGIFDQAGNADYFWAMSSSSENTYSELPVPANEGFDEVAEKTWNTTGIKKLSFVYTAP
jgi:hypothetical protein